MLKPLSSTEVPYNAIVIIMCVKWGTIIYDVHCFLGLCLLYDINIIMFYFAQQQYYCAYQLKPHAVKHIHDIALCYSMLGVHVYHLDL